MTSAVPPSSPGLPDPSHEGGTATSTLEQTRTEELTEPGDHERFAHYVRKDKITASAVTGQPVIALCGKVWVPTRDPSRFPVCPACKEIFESMRGGRPQPPAE